MALVVGGIKIDPQGQTLAVNITIPSTGQSVVAYTATTGPVPWPRTSSGAAASFPATISTPTTFYVTAATDYLVSAKLNGNEVAAGFGHTATVHIDGQVVTLDPAITNFPDEEVADIGTNVAVPTSGTLAARPGVTVKGQSYLATDTNGGTLYVSLDGVTWTQVAAGVSAAGAVASVYGRTGAVVATAGDYTAEQIGPSGAFDVAENLAEGVAATMRTNLGLGTAATHAATDFVPYGAQLVAVTDPAYAAVGDGTADDHAACTSALAAAKYVYFPQGQFNQNGKTLIIPDHVVAFGPGRSQDTAGTISGVLSTIMTAADMTGVVYTTNDTTFTATVATLPGATMTTNQWIGYTAKSGGSTGIITANTATTVTVAGGWKGGTPAAGSNMYIGNDLVQVGMNVNGSYATLRDITVDGGTHLLTTDYAAVRSLGADCELINVEAKSNSAGPAWWSEGNRCNFVNVYGQAQGSAGNDAIYMTSTDPLMLGGRFSGGRCYLGCTGLIATNVHWTGGNPNVEINGSSIFLSNCYYDSCGGTAVIKHTGGSRVHIDGGLIWQATPGVTAPAILQTSANTTGMLVTNVSVGLAAGVNQFTYLFSGPSGNVAARLFSIRCPGGTAAQLWDNPPSAWGRIFYGQNTSVTDMVTNTTTTITSATANFSAAVHVGASVSGTDIPAGATIVSVTNSTTADMSIAATGSHSGGSLTVSRSQRWLLDSGPSDIALRHVSAGTSPQDLVMDPTTAGNTAIAPTSQTMYVFKVIARATTVSSLLAMVGAAITAGAAGIALYESNGTTLTLRGSVDCSFGAASVFTIGSNFKALAAAAANILPGTTLYVAIGTNGATSLTFRGQGSANAGQNAFLTAGSDELRSAKVSGVTWTAVASFPTSVLVANLIIPDVNFPWVLGIK